MTEDSPSHQAKLRRTFTLCTLNISSANFRLLAAILQLVQVSEHQTLLGGRAHFE